MMIESVVRSSSSSPDTNRSKNRNSGITSAQLERLIRVAFEKTGIALQMFEDDYLCRQLVLLMNKHGITSPDALVERINAIGTHGKNQQNLYTGRKKSILSDLLELIPGKATKFFRDTLEFKKVTDAVSALPQTEELKILSAGCGSGEEPYSIALAIKRNFEKVFQKTKITGIELSPLHLEIGKSAQYPICYIEHIPKEYREYVDFSSKQTTFTFKKEILNSVELVSTNLLDDKLIETYASSFHLIALRYVVIYMKPKYSSLVIDNMSKILVKDGYLWLGIGEFIDKPADFSLEIEDTSLYRRT